MSNSIKSFSLAIDGSANILSIALLDKIKVLKVKHLNFSSKVKDIDDHFISIMNFFNQQFPINSLYVGCGPGSFTGLRRTISFAKAFQLAQKKLKNSVFSSIAINSLAALPYKISEKKKLKDFDYLLSVIDSKCNDFFTQLYSTKKNTFNLPILPISKIATLTIDEFDSFVESHSIEKKRVVIIGLPDEKINNNSFKLKCLRQQNYLPSAEDIGKLGHIIQNRLSTYNSVINKKFEFYNIYLNPIYARSPNIN